MKSSQVPWEKVEMERKIGGNQRIIQGEEVEGGEMLGGFIWTSVGLVIFYRKRQNYGKGSVFIRNSGNITAQTRCVLQCHRLTTQLPRIRLRDI